MHTPKKTDTVPQLKYNIGTRLAKMPVADSKDARKRILTATKVDESTFRRWQQIGMYDYQDIPAQKLDAIAHCLGCQADELKNYRPVNTNTHSHEPANQYAVR